MTALVAIAVLALGFVSLVVGACLDHGMGPDPIEREWKERL